MSRTYWVDLTDLYLWTGYHTGIQRTVYNLAKFYAERSDAKFFIYNERQREFYEISFSAIKAPAKHVKKITRRSEAKAQLKYQLKTAYMSLPEAWRKTLNPIVKPVAKQAIHKANHLLYTTRQARNTPRHEKPQTPAKFAPGDAVIIIGAGWIRPTIVNELWRRKQTVPFKVIHFIHDMIPTYHPHLFGPGHFELATTYMFEAITASDLIVTNSESSKRDTQRFMAEVHLPEVPVSVMRLGDELLDLAEPVKPEIQPRARLIPVRRRHARGAQKLHPALHRLQVGQIQGHQAAQAHHHWPPGLACRRRNLFHPKRPRHPRLHAYPQRHQ